MKREMATTKDGWRGPAAGRRVVAIALVVTAMGIAGAWCPAAAHVDAAACEEQQKRSAGANSGPGGTRARPGPPRVPLVHSYSNFISFRGIDSFDPEDYPVREYEAMEAYLAAEREAGRLPEEYGLVNFLTFGEADSLLDSVISANSLADAVLDVQLGVPLVWREAKDSYVVSSWLNLADIHVVKTGVRESDGAHLLTVIDTGMEPLVRPNLPKRSV